MSSQGFLLEGGRRVRLSNADVTKEAEVKIVRGHQARNTSSL